MEFESLNAVDGGEGQARYEESGSPIIPSLMVEGRMFPVLHPSQIASLLDLPRPEDGNDSVRLAWDGVTILQSWIELLPSISWEQVSKPTPSRGRSVRNLTVNVFRPYELLPLAWRTRRFDWRTGEEDAKVERRLPAIESLESYARKILQGWEAFLMEVGDDLTADDPLIESNRGSAPYSVVLRSQRWHAAFHHRQIVDFLRSERLDLEGALDVEGIEDLDLPAQLY